MVTKEAVERLQFHLRSLKVKAAVAVELAHDVTIASEGRVGGRYEISGAQADSHAGGPVLGRKRISTVLWKRLTPAATEANGKGYCLKKNEKPCKHSVLSRAEVGSL